MVGAQFAWPHLESEEAMALFRDQLASASWDPDQWLRDALAATALPAGVERGLEAFESGDGRATWRGLGALLRPDPRARLSARGALEGAWLGGAAVAATAAA